MASTDRPVIALGPDANDPIEESVRRAGADVVLTHDGTVPENARGLVWLGGADDFPTSLPDGLEWVQLPSAGVESWFTSGVITPGTRLTWTSAAGAYSDTVAEHALMLLLAGVRGLPAYLARTSWDDDAKSGTTDSGETTRTLHGATVGIVGAGGIGRTVIRMLAPLGAHTIAVNRSGREVEGAGRTIPTSEIDSLWDDVDHIVVAAPATDRTRHIVGAAELARLRPHSWVVNIARGSLVDTDALVEALRAETIGGAALDVTDPEPLPDGHPLWTLPNAIVTPHVANPWPVQEAALARHVEANVARFVAGEPLHAQIDPAAGY
ncbi:hydroxyacid dehydrogenase [Rhodococcus rhodnii]|uniref:Phosphoglycerate dehydrogenase n=2 Tax=Rhodococcus rhodnii TaxID=38312 RepID=R7WMD5_9NOCA|nr:D-isomer specific 2-hydroxyacid dehydrogenase family protein [Rhodococcus rhodnii]EOM76435.1 phosphoglycerate dehydrogenase [Rhodococcus rhodnii LMG 5362]TXG91549.1 hydroxyacid dehydrogenase [Rhodococcus rhodnii]